MERVFSAPIEIEPDEVAKVYSREQTEKWEEDWLEVFYPHQVKPKSRALPYLWAAFPKGVYPALSGEAAVKAYDAQVAPGYVILPDDFKLAVLSTVKPENAQASEYYVFPENMAWIMAFTHEDYYGENAGPYFARNKDYEKLDQKNRFKVKKKAEIEVAKRQGWL